MSEFTFTDEVNDKGNTVSVAHVDGSPVGRIFYRRDETELYILWLQSSTRREGVATALVEHALEGRKIITVGRVLPRPGIQAAHRRFLEDHPDVEMVVLGS